MWDYSEAPSGLEVVQINSLQHALTVGAQLPTLKTHRFQMVSEKEGFARIVTDLHSALQEQEVNPVSAPRAFAKYAESMSSNRDIEGVHYLNICNSKNTFCIDGRMPPGVPVELRTVLASLCLLLSP